MSTPADDDASTDRAIAALTRLEGEAQYRRALEFVEARAHALGVRLSKVCAVSVSGNALTLTMARDGYGCLQVESITEGG